MPDEDQPALASLIDALAESPRGVDLATGKGGGGKTTIAVVATAVARRGLRVHLSTTDPAAHIAEAVRERPAGMIVSRIDAAAKTRPYRDEVLSTAGAGLDAKRRALLEDDLRSPCIEEVAALRASARAVAGGEDARWS